MSGLSYASLLELREAIQNHRPIRFTAGGVTYTAEPHSLISAKRSGSFQLIVWVTDGSDVSAPGWRKFNYCAVRGLDVLRGAFTPRPLGPIQGRLLKA